MTFSAGGGINGAGKEINRKLNEFGWAAWAEVSHMFLWLSRCKHHEPHVSQCEPIWSDLCVKTQPKPGLCVPPSSWLRALVSIALSRSVGARLFSLVCPTVCDLHSCGVLPERYHCRAALCSCISSVWKGEWRKHEDLFIEILIIRLNVIQMRFNKDAVHMKWNGPCLSALRLSAKVLCGQF